MDPVPEAKAGVAFGNFRVVPHRREIIANGRPLKLGGRAFDVLMALIEARGAVVGKDALMARVWPDRVVEENNLQAQIVALRKAFGVERDLIRTVSGRGYQFTGEIRTLAASPDEAAVEIAAAEPGSVVPPTNIPEAVSELIGRDAEIEEAFGLTADAHRLVTLTGAGGIGKTTLALALARELRPHFADGVWLVEFSALADPGLVPATVAAAVGLEVGGGSVSAQRVAQALAGRRLLLVLDTCEHVIEAAAAISEAALAAESALHIIATSREPLRAGGERVYPVQPLAVPAPDVAADEDLTQYGAVRLFIERARAAEPHFAPERRLLATIASICCRLDGIPLAIELAAARASALGIEEIAARLEDRFGLLTGGRRTALPRHQTLRATLDWSHALLAEPERVILRRLAVFVSSFSIRAAGAVAAGLELAPSQIVDGLSSLVSKSLVTVELGAQITRYRLLDMTRAYALEKLDESGERQMLARRHAEYYRDIFERAEAEWSTRPAAEWLADYGPRIDNLRVALDWAVSPAGDPAIGAELAAVSGSVWIQMGLLAECCGWTAAALAVLPPGQVGTRQEMALQLAFGFSRMLTRGLTEDAHTALVRATELGKALDDLDFQLRALVGLVIFSRMSADFSPALTLSRQVDAIADEIATPLALATADGLLASSLFWVGEYAEARTRAERASQQTLPEVRQAHLARYGYDHRINSLTVWAQILWLQGFAEQSIRATRDVVAEAEKTSQRFTLPYVLVTTGCLVPLWVGDFAVAEQSIAQLKAETDLKGLRNYHAAALGLEGMLYAARGDTAAGERLLRQSIAGLRETGFYMFYMFTLTQLPEVLTNGGKLDEGLAVADEALRRVREAHFYRCIPEALRIKGEILLRARKGDDAEAEDLFRQSLDFAGRQGALAWELRSAASLARLRLRQGRAGEAHAILASVYDRFVEGFETADLVAARRLLEELNDAGRD